MTDSKFKKTADIIRDVIPPFLIRKISGFFYGWRGNYRTWADAKRKCKGYGIPDILEKVKTTSLKVRDGIIPYERDSVAFDKIVYSFPLLSALLWIANRNNGKLNVLDFGGSLGSTYFQNKKFLDELSSVNWCIVEQPNFVKTGIEDFATPNLHFFYTINDCTKMYPPDVMIFSSVLQYLESPFFLLDEAFATGVKYIIIDQTRFLTKGKDRITIQKVPNWIYKAEYCSWFFNEEKFINYFSPLYNLVFDFEIPENINVKSICKGYFFKRK